jgi:hypothetical protein
VLRSLTIPKVITLLEEGLQLNSGYGEELVQLSLKVISNITKKIDGVREVQSHGGIFSLLRCLSLNNDKLKKLASEGLVHCSSYDEHKRYLVDMKSVRVLMNLLDSIDLEIA